jgi:hypothetical protein
MCVIVVLQDNEPWSNVGNLVIRIYELIIMHISYFALLFRSTGLWLFNLAHLPSIHFKVKNSRSAWP